MALHQWSRIWRFLSDLGLQRHALPGTILLGIRRRHRRRDFSGTERQRRRLGSISSTRSLGLETIAAGRAIKEVEFVGIQDRPFYLVYGVEPQPLLVEPSPLRIRRESFSMDSVMTRVKEGNPDVPIAESQVLSDYDSYYHPRESKPPLPVIRVKFADADSTWFYIDPHMSQVAGSFTRRQRLQRWIYHGFHSLDFNFWYYQGPVWQFTMIVLNAGGALLSIIGVVLSIKRLGRGFRRTMTSAKTPRT
jgi:hypothetical protein